MGGGGMSERFSGDTDPFSSDSSVAMFVGIVSRDRSSPPLVIFVSVISLKTWDTKAGFDAVFRRCGFDIGDCRTPLFRLDLAALFFRVFFDKSDALLWLAGRSGFGTSGEFVEVLFALCSYPVAGSVCACSAGEVRGLKYAPGTVYAASTGKLGSRGVTAGETSGVKANCATD